MLGEKNRLECLNLTGTFQAYVEAEALGVTKFITIFAINLVTLYCAAQAWWLRYTTNTPQASLKKTFDTDTNTLAYYARAEATQKKSFLSLNLQDVSVNAALPSMKKTQLSTHLPRVHLHWRRFWQKPLRLCGAIASPCLTWLPWVTSLI
jgi:hypothetical protein